MKRIGRNFFSKNTLTVAKSLLGNILCRQIDDKIYKGIIVETEGYIQEDPACHAYKGLTKRSKSLFMKPGTVYVYLIYGVHFCVNMVTDAENYGSGVLIRAIEPFCGFEDGSDTSGPAKLCKHLCITKDFDGTDVTGKNSPLWLEYGSKIDDINIIQTTRIGIKKAADYPWRFYIKGNKYVSRV